LGRQLQLQADMLKDFDKRLADEIAVGADPVEVLWAHHK
jgi:hypothetical protein